jgi:hypothetical protein
MKPTLDLPLKRFARGRKYFAPSGACGGASAPPVLPEIQLSTQPVLCFYSRTAWTNHVCLIFRTAIMPAQRVCSELQLTRFLKPISPQN